MARCNVLSNSSQESHALSAAITAAAAGIVAAAAGTAATAATTATTAATAAGTAIAAIAAGATVPAAAANKQDQDENPPAVKAIVAVVAHNRFLLFQFFHSHTIAGTTRR